LIFYSNYVIFIYMDRLLRIGEASRILGVSVSTLRRWEKEGKIKPYRVEKERRYSYEELQSLLGKKYEYFVEFFKALGVEVTAVNGKEFKEPKKELVEDLIAILTSFTGKLYGLKANKLKKVISELKSERASS